MLIPILICLLLLSALLSASETAFFLVAKNRLLIQSEKLRVRRGNASAVLACLENPNRLLMTLLLGNLLVNLAFFAFSSLYVFELEKHGSMTESIVLSLVFLFVLVFFSEILPKTMASSYPLRCSRLAAPLISALTRVLAPATGVLESMVRGFNRLIGIKKGEDPSVDPEMLREVLEVGRGTGALHEGGAELLGRLIGLREIRLKEICTPRVDMRTCPRNATVAEVLVLARKWRLHTIPLHDPADEEVYS
ncbi:MAG: DUF21 domain-containing protein, partial [Planctomycetes bacterium]|nr:DUF21 domain-containing protein [Planctomycetota bacterium]